jgi:hypothetical protein
VKPSPYVDVPNRPVFAGGCPRSGTTMFRTMLNAHPELALPHETRFVVDGYRKRAQWGDLTKEKNRRKLARWVVKRKKSRFERITKDPTELVEAMAAAPPTMGSVLSAGFKLYAGHQDKPRWGDKRPAYAINLDAVFAMWPDAQFINVVRDPRAAVASIRKIGWYKDGIPAGIELWERTLRRTDRWRRRLGPDQFLEIRYEALVADPAAVLERVVGFLGLDPAGLEQMVAFHERADIRSKTTYALVSQPITTSPMRTWEQTMTRQEIALVEHALAGPMARYGYEPVLDGVAVDPVMRKQLWTQRYAMRREDARTLVDETKLRFAYRQPVADVRSAGLIPG